MKITDLLQEINPLYLDDLKSPDHYSMFINEQNYQILIVRGLSIGEESLEFLSKGLVLNASHEVYIYNQEDENLTKVDDGLAEISNLLRPIYEKNEKIVQEYITEIDQLEDSLFERKASRIFMDIWFDLKKDLSKIERHFFRNQSVLREFYRTNLNNPDFREGEFKDIMEQVRVNEHNAHTQLLRLEALYNYYVSIKNDKLNNNIYTMTLLSAVFLPLNLIVGFFGMNTENLFFKDNPQGTKFVLAIIVGSLMFSIFGLPLIRFIDSYILKFFLGRYDIYKKFTSKIDKIESSFKLR